MRRAVFQAIRALFVTLLLPVALLVLPWPGADDELHRFPLQLENAIPVVTERDGGRTRNEGNEQAVREIVSRREPEREGATAERDRPFVRVFRGSRETLVRREPEREGATAARDRPAVRVLRGSGPQGLSGLAGAIDGDTLEVNGVRVRLHGIDAPEHDQPCWFRRQRWPCGLEAKRVLANQLHGRQVVCEVRDRDVHGRIVATCSIAGRDINAWMVEEGWALAYRRYSHAYVVQEARAQRGRRGLWRSQFVPPWEWRETRRR